MDNTLEIVNYLGKNMGRGFTMHELSKLLGIPYASFYRTVKRMQDLLIIDTVGRAKTVRLNLKNPTIKSYLAIASEEERKEYLQKQPIIRKIANEIQTTDTIALFGSYADSTQAQSSDIDLLIINKNGKKSFSFSKYELLFKKRINPIFVTKKEFQLMLKDKEENVSKQVLNKHVILKNPEAFWEAVLDAVRQGRI